MADQFVTPLDQQQEVQYQQWRQALPGNLQNDGDYDLRGAYVSGLKPSENNHLPDTYKKPNHPTFSRESAYSTDQTPGGEWVDLGNDKWAFNATQYNVDSYGLDKLKSYFQQYEPNSQLILPDQYQQHVPVPTDPK